MIQFKADNRDFNMKVVVTIVLLLTSNLLGFTQDSNERKQLFDYDWKFFLGDTAAAKQNAGSVSIQKPKLVPNDLATVFKIYL